MGLATTCWRRGGGPGKPSAVMANPTPGDRTTTAVTYDGAFRVIALRTTHTVRESLRAQAVVGNDAPHLADLLTGTILVRLTMAPTLRVQGIIQGADRSGTLVGDSHPDGTARGLVQRRSPDHEVTLGPGALMQMIRTMPKGTTNQGVVEIPDGSVGGALMAYLSGSEQITATAMVCARFEQGALEAAGGYIVQLLPEVSRAPLAVMAERLDADFSTAEQVLPLLEDDPAKLMGEILYGMKFAQTQEAELRFGCHCSSLRLLSSLATLPKADIQELVESGEPLHITCDYCGKPYELAPRELEGLLASN